MVEAHASAADHIKHIWLAHLYRWDNGEQHRRIHSKSKANCGLAMEMAWVRFRRVPRFETDLDPDDVFYDSVLVACPPAHPDLCLYVPLEAREAGTRTNTPLVCGVVLVPVGRPIIAHPSGTKRKRILHLGCGEVPRCLGILLRPPRAWHEIWTF